MHPSECERPVPLSMPDSARIRRAGCRRAERFKSPSVAPGVLAAQSSRSASESRAGTSKFASTDRGVDQDDQQLAYRDYQRQRQLTLGDLLLENRIILLQGEIHDGNANELVMKLLYLQSENRRKDIHFYINSPGGSVTRHAGHLRHDADSRLARWPPTASVWRPAAARCCWPAAPRANAYALPHAKVMIHQPYGQVGGQVSDIEIQADEILKTREVLNEILAAAHRPADRADRQGHRPRLLHDRRRGQGVRRRRRHPHRAADCTKRARTRTRTERHAAGH